MTEAGLREHFDRWERGIVAFEVGGHSRWVKRVLSSMGFEALVADPRRPALITKSTRKNDRNDARRLAELASASLTNPRLDLMNPVVHRDDHMQADLAILKARDSLVLIRTQLINMVRGTIKSTGHRLRSCSTPSFDRLKEDIPEALKPACVRSSIFDQLALLTKQIRAYDRTIAGTQNDHHAEVGVLLGVRGVGALTAMALRLTLADPTRFKRSRDLPRSWDSVRSSTSAEP